MIRKLVIIAATSVIILLCPGIADAGISGNINFMPGSKLLNMSDWEPVEEQPAFGLLYDMREAEWPLNFALSAVHSEVSSSYYSDTVMGDVTIEAVSNEYNIGVKKIWDENQFHPYLGGGISVIESILYWEAYGFDTIKTSGSGTGIWLSAGGYRTFARFNLGANLTYSYADTGLNYPEGKEVKVNGGGITAGLLLGIHLGH